MMPGCRDAVTIPSRARRAVMRVVLALLAGCAVGTGPDPGPDRSGRSTTDGVAGGSRPGDGPLVLELFTSQGCSSCPPADQLLSKLAHDGELGGRRLAPL